MRTLAYEEAARGGIQDYRHLTIANTRGQEDTGTRDRDTYIRRVAACVLGVYARETYIFRSKFDTYRKFLGEVV